MTIHKHSPRQQARALVAQYWEGYLPVDVLALATKLHIVVKPVPELTDSEGNSLITASGFEEKVPTIVYCANNNLYAIRFAIAHAIGHHVLGHVRPESLTTLLIDNTLSIYGQGYSAQEVEASLFAAELLMPPDVVHYRFRTSDDTMESLSAAFQVPLKGVSLQLKALGYLPDWS